MDGHDDPIKGMLNDAEDNSAVGELEFDLNQLRELEQTQLLRTQMQMGSLILIEVATNESRPLSVDDIVNEYLAQPIETV